MRAQILLKLGCSFTCEAAGCNTIAHDVLPWHPVVLNPWGAAHELSAADVLSHFSHSSVAGYSTAGTHLLIHFSVHKVVPGLSWLVQSTVQETHPTPPLGSSGLHLSGLLLLWCSLWPQHTSSPIPKSWSSFTDRCTSAHRTFASGLGCSIAAIAGNLWCSHRLTGTLCESTNSIEIGVQLHL